MFLVLKCAPFHNIVPSIGLKLSDISFSYLFIIGAETFSRLFHLAKNNSSLHGIKIARNVPIVSHLLYTYDLILYCCANM